MKFSHLTLSAALACLSIFALGLTGCHGDGECTGLPNHISVWGEDSLTIAIYVSDSSPETAEAPHLTSGGFGLDYVFEEDTCGPMTAVVSAHGAVAFDAPVPIEIYGVDPQAGRIIYGNFLNDPETTPIVNSSAYRQAVREAFGCYIGDTACGESLPPHTFLKRDVAEHFSEDPADYESAWVLYYDGSSTGGVEPQAFTPHQLKVKPKLDSKPPPPRGFSVYSGSATLP